MSHRVWAEIHMKNLEHNIKQIQNHIPKTAKIMAVVKADAYGHGYKNIAHHLEKCGIANFGVATITEAVSLRQSGIQGTILIFGRTPPEKLKQLVDGEIMQTVLSLEHAREISAYGQKHNITINTHVKLDTGMSRAGFSIRQKDTDLKELQTLFSLPNIKIRGIYSHFSCADELSDASVDFTKRQIETFDRVVRTLEDKGYDLGVKHLQNSAGIINYDWLSYDLVRPGIMIYGYTPSDEVKTDLKLKPVLELKALITQIKTITKGTPVSYGRTFIADYTMRTATVSIGYGDGYFRSLSGKGEVVLHDTRAKIIGKVCMDQLVIDVSSIANARVGDEVSLFGDASLVRITADEVAKKAGTINYEILCSLGKRVNRIPV